MSPRTRRVESSHRWLASVYETAGELLWEAHQAKARITEVGAVTEEPMDYVEDRFNKANASLRLVVASAEQAHAMGHTLYAIRDLIDKNPGKNFEELIQEEDFETVNATPPEVMGARFRWLTTLKALDGEGADA